MKEAIIRFAKAVDLSQIVELCHAHALYEEATYNSNDKVLHLKEALFCVNPSVFCLVVEREGRLIGYSTYMKQYATWDACHYIYMDCLFLTEDARGFGLGEKLIEKIKQEAIKEGIELIQWQTPDFNTRAIKFYRRIGAVSKTKERFFLAV